MTSCTPRTHDKRNNVEYDIEISPWMNDESNFPLRSIGRPRTDFLLDTMLYSIALGMRPGCA